MKDNTAKVVTPYGVCFVNCGKYTIVENQNVNIAVRGENIRIEDMNYESGLSAVISDVNFVGNMLRTTLLLSDGSEVVSTKHGITSEYSIGQQVKFTFDPSSAVFVDME